MMDDLTHKIEVIITGYYQHGGKTHSSVTVSGDGGIDHMLSTFKAAFVAAGYDSSTADKYIGDKNG